MRRARRPSSTAPALAFALALAATTGCSGSQRPGPPRSSCADAAASIARGLRSAAPSEAERVAELEPRFVDVCRSSGWRPNIVRCFAIARDPAEHRICARRMPPAQRDEARLLQAQLYGPASARAPRSQGSAGEHCRAELGPALEAAFMCDRLSPFDRLELNRHVDAVVTAMATAGTDPRRLSEISDDCGRLAEKIRAALARVGC